MHTAKIMYGYGEKVAGYKPRREASEESKPVDRLILGF